MKINEVLSKVNSLKPNDYDVSEKIAWLTELDSQIKREVIDTYEGGDKITFKEYTETDQDVELLAQSPYDEMYLYYLISKIDWFNGEYSKYNANMSMFNTIYANYQAWYIRNHKSIGTKYITYF